ncbi:LOW QUALITY PROTEIN: Hypothetical protein PHPALM_13825 [Phytophthora palmivora]|uniref:Uncharacterized protein n=1 Tax=Phytophthora palmivora TaxID=4796 RepID=A0A2P4XWM4_9STRA|nr:LOW QUALITY PROTEIN: Hypothetical protein PHPALM_13825 [Phytophthora palmivora]
MLIDNVIPTIKSKYPLFLQETEIQDGARCHVNLNDLAIIAPCKEDGWNIRVEFQPPSSPDLGILDLGYFCSIQALQYEESPSNIAELINVTIASCNTLKDSTLKVTFVSLQKVKECVIHDRGNNSYRRPHVGKAKLRKNELRDRSYVCDALVYLEAYEEVQ